jgi:hypothetical protein
MVAQLAYGLPSPKKDCTIPEGMEAIIPITLKKISGTQIQ